MPSNSFGGGSPITSGTGLITGYGNTRSKATALTPVTGSNGLITGYNQTNINAQDNSITGYDNPGDPTGKYNFNPGTGLNAQGLTRGQQAAQDLLANTAPVAITKSKPVADATATTMANENNLQTTAIKSFSDYLNEAEQLQQQGAAAVKQDTATANKLPSQLESQLSDTTKNFATTAAGLNDQVTALNDQNAAQTNANIQALDKINSDYEANARAVAAQSVAAAQARSNAMQSASGTPRSDSGYWDQVTAKNYSDIMLPVEANLAQNRIGQLENYITPQQQQVLSGRLSQITGLELPVANTLVQLGITNAQQVTQLTQQLMGRPLAEQIQYLSALGLPLQVAESLAQSLPQALAQISNIDLGNTNYGLASDYQNPVAGGLPTYGGQAQPSPTQSSTVYNFGTGPTSTGTNVAAAPVTKTQPYVVPSSILPTSIPTYGNGAVNTYSAGDYNLNPGYANLA